MKSAPETSPLRHPVLSRRAAIQAGGIGLLGLTMGELSALKAHAGASNARSVIYIFLSGGLSQHDTFDMKPDAPSDVRGEFQSIRTKTPGLHICEHLPELAKRSHLWSICRSLSHEWNEHSQGHHIMLTGQSDIPTGFDPRAPKESDWPSIAAIANQVLTPRGNLPPALVLPDKIVHRTGRTLPGQFGGRMGSKYDPFFVEASPYMPKAYGAYPDYLFHHATGSEDPQGKVFGMPGLTLPEGMDFERLRNRMALMNHLNEQQGYLESLAETQGMDRYQQMAADLLFDPKTKAAFDVHAVADQKQDRYGRNAFGWSLLMARQLVEAGVGLVQVNLGNNEAWDNHQAIFPNLRDYLLPPMDRAVSALLDDLHESGMLEDTLVVMASEFGRTPKITTLPSAKLPGRDHWGALQTVFFAGGGVQGGRVVGSSDKIGAYPASDPQKPEDFAATIYHSLGLPPEAKWFDPVERPNFIYHGKPIAGLFS